MMAAAASLGRGGGTDMGKGDIPTQQHQSLVDDPEIWGQQSTY